MLPDEASDTDVGRMEKTEKTPLWMQRTKNRRVDIGGIHCFM